MRPIQPDDALAIRVVADSRLSPDATTVVCTLTEAFTSGRSHARSALWLVPAAGGTPAPLTGGAQADVQPRWSPDGRRIAFLSDRDEAGGAHYRLYLIDPASGRITPVSCPSGDIVSYQWAPDGGALAVVLQPKDAAGEGDPIRFEAEPPCARLWLVPLGGGEPRPVTPPDLQVWEFDWSPDGRRFALVSSAAPYEWAWYQTKLTCVAAEGGDVDTLYDPGHRQLARPLWSPDGSRVAFLCASLSDRGSVGADLWAVPAGGGVAQDLTTGYGGSVHWMEWESAESLLLLASEGFDTAIATLRPGQPLRYLSRGPFAVGPRFQPAFSRAGGLLAMTRESERQPLDVWTCSAGGEWRQLTNFNPQVAQFELGEMQVRRWRSFDGQEIEGLLTLPLGYRPGQRCPLVVYPHGGPTACTHRRWSPGWSQFLAARGRAVLAPNYRGSTGRGLAFAEANLGDMGGGDWQDILAGVDDLVAAGIADPERLGFAGWSYGGFLTAWAVTQSRRFKAAVMGAGIANWLSFHGRSYLQTWDKLYLQGSPYRGDTYSRWSPIFSVDRVQTPTLLLHGERDGDVPVGQSYEFHRALLEHGVPTQLVVYPREPHGPREAAHVRDIWQRHIDWFTQYLGL